MAWFKKKDKVIDLGERYRKQQEAKASMPATQEIQTAKTQENSSPFAFFDSAQAQDSEANTSTSSDEEFVDLSDTIGGRRKKLAKRILDMTTKMEDLSNQIYHLQQRIEVLERKLDVNRYE